MSVSGWMGGCSLSHYKRGKKIETQKILTFKSPFLAQEGFSANLMVSSTTLQLDKSLWPLQILLVYRCKCWKSGVFHAPLEMQTDAAVEKGRS